MDFNSNEYDNKVVLGDFNLDHSRPSMFSFMDNQNFVNLKKNKMCFKETGCRIDLILTNRKYSFKNTSSCETGLNDHHHLIYSVMKTKFKCEESKNIIYRNYSIFSQKDFQKKIYAPKQYKFFRGNRKPHINKTLRKAIMNRSQLKNKTNKTKAL